MTNICPPELDSSITNFRSHLKESSSCYVTAKNTAQLIYSIIARLKWKSTDDLVNFLQSLNKDVKGDEDSPVIVNNSVASNVILRVIKIISTEDVSYLGSTSEQFLTSLLKKPETKSGNHVTTGGLEASKKTKDETSGKGSQKKKELKEAFVDCLEEYIVELENSCSNIAAQSLDHIHGDEIILTIGHSHTVCEFLQEASVERSFQVLVAEAAPSYKGHEMAQALTQSDIKTTLLPDSNVFAVMSRVNKVIIGSDLILADGAVITCAGALSVAQAAKHFSVPVICCGSFYKVTPTYLPAQDPQKFNILMSPQLALPMKHISSLKTHVANPACDLIPAQFLTLLISSLGGHDPSFIFKLIFDLYPGLD